MSKVLTLSKKQLEYLEWEFGVFFHFGIRSFYPGHKDWDGLEMSLSGFNPTDLNADEWCQTAKNAGATYVLLTCKHHDGFALWQSGYTEYGVKNTPWKGGKGDVVREYVDAARRAGLKVGLYYSPAQWGTTAVKFENGKEYDDYFINQISELLTGYGKIDYLWFDGCGSEDHEYDKKRIVNEIFRLQPDILTFCNAEWYPTVRWIGNEDGYASMNNPLVVRSIYFSELATKADTFPEDTCIPAECDAKMRNSWFFDNNEDTLKSLDELFGMYEASVGNGSNFLLNISPDDRGRLPEADKNRLLELGEKIRKYETPTGGFGNAYKDGEKEYSIKAAEYDMPWGTRGKNPQVINRIVIEEDLTDGQNVKAFDVYFYPSVYKDRKLLVYRGATIGRKTICHIPAIYASKITVEITESDGEAKIKSIKTYKVN